jgi:hypothetical protein
MLSFLRLPHQWGSSSRAHDKCHTDARYETYNHPSVAEVTDWCRRQEIATLPRNAAHHIDGTRSPPQFPPIALLLNYFGNSKSNAFNDILAFDLPRTMAPRGSG